MNREIIIDLANVSKTYNQGKANEVEALVGVDLTVDQGEMIAVKGPSGSGKTTLLSIIGCVFSPTSGKAIVAGKKLSRLPEHFLTRYRRELIGFVFQNYNLLDYLSVLDNVMLPLLPLGLGPKKRRLMATTLLDKFGVSHRANFTVNMISGGELQRVALARALINNPPIIVADEPTAHLDSVLAKEVMTLLTDLKDEGKTIILSSHDPRVFEHSGVDRVVSVSNGKLQS